jgi:integrase
LIFGRTEVDAFVPSTVRSRALRAWEAAGLAPIGLHECRHTFASLLIAAGVNAKAVSVAMGHATITMTYDTYGHLFSGAVDEVAAQTNAYLARVGGAGPALSVVG